MRTGINLIRINALLAWPVIPETSKRILAALGREGEAGHWPEDIASELGSVAAGEAFEVPDVLFTKIDDEQIETWTEKFSGDPDS